MGRKGGGEGREKREGEGWKRVERNLFGMFNPPFIATSDFLCHCDEASPLTNVFPHTASACLCRWWGTASLARAFQ